MQTATRQGRCVLASCPAQVTHPTVDEFTEVAAHAFTVRGSQPAVCAPCSLAVPLDICSA